MYRVVVRAVARQAPRLLAIATLIAGCFAAIGPADAATIRVSQETSAGAGDFDADILGFINPFQTALSISDFYQYGTPDAFSYNGDANGGPPPASSITQMFFVLASDGLNLVVVHDNPQDGSGGSANMQTVLLGGSGGTADFKVADDGSSSDTYQTLNPAPNRVFNTAHTWLDCCTDGFAIGALNVGDTIYSSFSAAPTGIEIWATVNGDNTFGQQLLLIPGRRVRFDVVPLPAALPLFGTGLALIGLAGWRRRRAAP